jgi:hypothetical protein
MGDATPGVTRPTASAHLPSRLSAHALVLSHSHSAGRCRGQPLHHRLHPSLPRSTAHRSSTPQLDLAPQRRIYHDCVSHRRATLRHGRAGHANDGPQAYHATHEQACPASPPRPPPPSHPRPDVGIVDGVHACLVASSHWKWHPRRQIQSPQPRSPQDPSSASPVTLLH